MGRFSAKLGIANFSVHYYNFMNRDTYLWTGRRERECCGLFHHRAWVMIHVGWGDYRKAGCCEHTKCQ